MKGRMGKTAGLLAVCILLQLSWSIMAQAAEMVSVRGEDVRLRAQGSVAGEILWELGDGFPLRVVQRQGDWIKVRDFEDDTGWIAARKTSRKAYVIVSANRERQDRANIRQGPGTEHPVVARAAYGVVLEVLENRKEWVKVRHEKGVTGWISAGLVWGR